MDKGCSGQKCGGTYYRKYYQILCICILRKIVDIQDPSLKYSIKWYFFIFDYFFQPQITQSIYMIKVNKLYFPSSVNPGAGVCGFMM